MSGTVYTFTWVPDFNAKNTHQDNVKVTAFGDGYEQRSTFGINQNPDVWSLTFASRTDDEASSIWNFLYLFGGLTSFQWTPPGSTIPIKVKCNTFDKTIKAGNGSAVAPAYIWDVTATFTQVFEP